MHTGTIVVQLILCPYLTPLLSKPAGSLPRHLGPDLPSKVPEQAHHCRAGQERRMQQSSQNFRPFLSDHDVRVRQQGGDEEGHLV